MSTDEEIEREAMIRSLARLKLRLEVCLRRDRTSDEYRGTLASCLGDVDSIARLASDLHSTRAPMNEIHRVE
jgi:hypothetical protein